MRKSSHYSGVASDLWVIPIILEVKVANLCCPYRGYSTAYLVAHPTNRGCGLSYFSPVRSGSTLIIPYLSHVNNIFSMISPCKQKANNWAEPPHNGPPCRHHARDRVTWFRFHQDGLHGRRGVEMEEDLEKDGELHGKIMENAWEIHADSAVLRF